MNEDPTTGKPTRLPPCPGTPNCVSSDPGGGTHRVNPYRITAEPAKAWGSLRDILESLPRTTIRTATQEHLEAEVRSRIFRFVDDMAFHLRADQNLIAVRSASRVGYWDFGVNRRRVEVIRDLLKSRGVAK